MREYVIIVYPRGDAGPYAKTFPSAGDMDRFIKERDLAEQEYATVYCDGSVELVVSV